MKFKLLHIPEAQWKSIVETNRVADDFCGKAMEGLHVDMRTKGGQVFSGGAFVGGS